MKSKIWPQRPRKWPLDLNDLGKGWVNFFKNYIFKISASSWKKWAIAWLSSQTFNFQFFLLDGGLRGQRVELVHISKSLNRKQNNNSFSSAWCTDFKNVIFEKKITEPLLRSLKSKGHFRDCWGQILASATLKMTSWPQQPQNSFSDFFSKIIVFKSVHQVEKNEL